LPLRIALFVPITFRLPLPLPFTVALTVIPVFPLGPRYGAGWTHVARYYRARSVVAVAAPTTHSPHLPVPARYGLFTPGVVPLQVQLHTIVDNYMDMTT